MKHAHTIRSKIHLLQQVKCISIYAIGATALLSLLSLLSTYNTILFHGGLLFFGWISWTFWEYIAHRFWLHGPGNRDLLNHAHHHSHPTEIRVTLGQRVFMTLSCIGVLYIAYKLQNYFTILSGFYIGLVGYLLIHLSMHRKWFGKYFPRLQQFHILHHLKLPNHCFGVTVYWWDFVFNTAPPKNQMPSDRIVQFYFHGKKRLLCIFLLPVIFTSCTHYYYAPTTANIPLLKEKGEARVNANFYITDEATGGELQVACATGKKSAVMFNLLTASSQGALFMAGNDPDMGPPAGAGTYAELGYGLFYPDPKSKWVFETYGGIGYGGITNRYTETEKSKVRITKLFVQPSFGWRSRFVEIGFSTRFAFAHLKVNQNTGHPDPEVEYIRNHPSSLLIEPGMVVRFGFRHFKFTLNYTHSGNMSHNWKQETTGIAAGMSFNITPDK